METRGKWKESREVVTKAERKRACVRIGKRTIKADRAEQEEGNEYLLNLLLFQIYFVLRTIRG